MCVVLFEGWMSSTHLLCSDGVHARPSFYHLTPPAVQTHLVTRALKRVSVKKNCAEIHFIYMWLDSQWRRRRCGEDRRRGWCVYPPAVVSAISKHIVFTYITFTHPHIHTNIYCRQWVRGSVNVCVCVCGTEEKLPTSLKSHYFIQIGFQSVFMCGCVCVCMKCVRIYMSYTHTPRTHINTQIHIYTECEPNPQWRHKITHMTRFTTMKAFTVLLFVCRKNQQREKIVGNRASTHKCGLYAQFI